MQRLGFPLNFEFGLQTHCKDTNQTPHNPVSLAGDNDSMVPLLSSSTSLHQSLRVLSVTHREMKLAELCLQRQVKPFTTNLCAGTLSLPDNFWRHQSLKSQDFWSLYFTGSNYPPVSRNVFSSLYSLELKVLKCLSLHPPAGSHMEMPWPTVPAGSMAQFSCSLDMIFCRPVISGSEDDLEVKTQLTQVRKPAKFLILFPIQQNFCLSVRQSWQV